MRWWRARKADVVGVSAVVGFVLAYLSPAIKDGWSFGSFDAVISFSSLGKGAYAGRPHNVLNGDSVTEMVPFNTIDWTAIHHLHFPLWNDLSLLGLPQFLNFQSAVLSLPNLVSYLAPLRAAFLVTVAVKLLIAGTGAYALCRVVGLRPLASVLGGVTFMLSGGIAAWVAWPLSGVVCWLAWIVTLAILSYQSSRRCYVVLLGLSVAFCVYGGFPEAYFFVATGLVTFFGVVVIVALVAKRRLEAGGIARAVTGILAGGVLSAPLWFPGLQVVDYSHRTTVRGFKGLPVHSLGLLVAPGYYGLPIKGSRWFFPGINYYETVVYVGVIALVLAGAAVLRWWRHPMVVASAAMVVVTIGISYQTKTFHPVSAVLRHSSFDGVPISRMRTIIGLPIGVLSALGLETLLRARDRRMLFAYWAASTIVAVFVAVLWAQALDVRLPSALARLRYDSLWWPIGLVAACVVAGVLFVVGRPHASRFPARSAVVAAAAVLVGAETAFLLFSGVGLNSYSERFFPTTPAIAALKAVVGSGLIGVDTGHPSDPQRIGRAGIYPEANLGYGLAEYAGYDPLLPKAYFTRPGGASYVEPDIYSASIARKYGIAWILQVPKMGLPRPPGTRYVATFAGERLFAVPGAARFVVLTGHSSEPVSSISHPVTSSWTIRIDPVVAGRLVMRITDLPGWHASDNGRALALSSYQHLMLEAPVPAGRDVIRLWYLPERLVIATWLALAVLAALLAWAIWPAVRRRSRPEPMLRDLGLSFAPALAAAELSCQGSQHTS